MTHFAPTGQEGRAVRLTPEQIGAIKHAAQMVLGDNARVVLFGSRTEPDKRGGDIDLLFQTQHAVANRAATIGQLYVALIRQLGDRKIDILLQDPTTPRSEERRVGEVC